MATPPATARRSCWQDGERASGGGLTPLQSPRYQRGVRRTLPDVAFPAAKMYPIALEGRTGCCVGGTSAAAPAWAGAITLLNQMRAGRIGFLNSRLYDLGRRQVHGGAAVFHDVTEGSNAIAGVRGFHARRGYDLATGWGTIDGEAFFAALSAP